MKRGSSEVIHRDLLGVIELVYQPIGMVISNVAKEVESEGYGAYTFEISRRKILFRVGKITEKKVGQFVTLWKRTQNGPITPFDLSDPIDLFIVTVRSETRFGQFVFPKALLYEKGILSTKGVGGKLAIRIYPPWDITESRLAKKTQSWQLLWFFEIYPGGPVDTSRIQKLFRQGF